MVWYIFFMIYFRGAGIFNLMENIESGVGMCLVLNLPASCLYVEYTTWIDYRSDAITFS